MCFLLPFTRLQGSPSVVWSEPAAVSEVDDVRPPSVVRVAVFEVDDVCPPSVVEVAGSEVDDVCPPSVVEVAGSEARKVATLVIFLCKYV